jgi:hypothetical protein
MLRRLALAIIMLIPLITLVHKNERHHWTTNRTAMVAPDEFSYLLIADALLHHHTISTQKTVGIDAFYPPGYPALLALWAIPFGLTPFAAHVLNTLAVCAATGVVYLFSRRLLDKMHCDKKYDAKHIHTPWRSTNNDIIALLIAALFATNWHVLESALYIFSEPAFMLITFAWLALPLKWPDWHLDWRKTLPVALLAIAAWSIRGAGIVCVAVTFLYPATAFLHQLIKRKGPATPLKRLLPLALILTLAIAYQLTITAVSPTKSLTGAGSNSYTQQLLRGITDAGNLPLSQPSYWPAIIWHTIDLGLSHINDYAASFTPWFRDPPDAPVRYLIAKIFGALALLGFLHHFTRKNPATRFLDIYILAYFALYILWPFNMARFWSPILPVMLVYLADFLRTFLTPRHLSPRITATLLGLLLILSIQELYLKLNFYQVRINHVSDSLATSAATVAKHSPDPAHTIVAVLGHEEHFTFGWYLPRAPGSKNLLPTSPRDAKPGETPERVEGLLLRCIDQMEKDPQLRVFAISYFREVDYARDILPNLQKRAPALLKNYELIRLYQSSDITTTWELRRKQK